MAGWKSCTDAETPDTLFAEGWYTNTLGESHLSFNKYNFENIFEKMKIFDDFWDEKETEVSSNTDKLGSNLNNSFVARKSSMTCKNNCSEHHFYKI